MRLRRTDPPLHYGGCPLARAATTLRTDPDRVAGLLADPGSRVVPLWRGRCLIRTGGTVPPVTLTGVAAAGVVAAAAQVVFLGLDGDTGVFTADLSPLPELAAVALAAADRSTDIRALVGSLSMDAAAVLGYARGVLHWHQNQRFCGTCGGRTESRDGGHARACLGGECGRLLFPRIEPAVIVLVESAGAPDRCLLGRHAGAPADSYSTLAGFVEMGESLEDAVRREIGEEVGVQVGAVTYQASQPWPFPAGLMVGFRARAVSDDLSPDGTELLEACWFTRADLRDRVAAGHRLGRPDSIDRFLLQSWLDRAEPA